MAVTSLVTGGRCTRRAGTPGRLLMLVLTLLALAGEQASNGETAKSTTSLATTPASPFTASSDREHAAKPVVLEARRFEGIGEQTNAWRMHGLLLEAGNDWDVQWINSRALSTAIGFVRSGPMVEGDTPVGASIAFFPETLEILHQQYTAESAGFRAVFPTVAELREGFATDLALFDTIAEVSDKALAEPVLTRSQAYAWMRVRSRALGDIRLSGKEATVHVRLAWSARPGEQRGWCGRGTIFDTKGKYRGTLVMRTENLDEAQRASFVAHCSDLVARLSFEDN